MQNVNKLCWLFTQNQCRNNISIREIDTLLFFPLDFILESRISPRRRSCRAANDTSLKHQDHKGYFGALEFLKSCKTLRCEARGLSFWNGGSTWKVLLSNVKIRDSVTLKNLTKDVDKKFTKQVYRSHC